MFIYWIHNNRVGELVVGPDMDWKTFTPGTAPVYLHPNLDYHFINGLCIIEGKDIKLIPTEPGFKFTVGGYLLLAHNHKEAMELV